MQQCAHCGHQNRAGVVFCENCGASLIGKVPLDTKSLDSSTEEEKSQLGLDANVLNGEKAPGIATFEEGTSLRLDIQGSTDPILFKPKNETIFGRRDPATGAMPDVDLTPFAGYRMGVSRRHAAIRSGDNQSLDLWDLGSSNGTFLNEERLNPHRPYRLRDGDEIRLGSMKIRIYFQHDEKSVTKPDSSDQAAVQTAAQPKAPPPVPIPAVPPASGVSTRIVEPLYQNTAGDSSPVVNAPAKPAEPTPESKPSDSGAPAANVPIKPADSVPAPSEPTKPGDSGAPAANVPIKPADSAPAPSEPAKPASGQPAVDEKKPPVDPPKANGQPDPTPDKSKP